MVASPLMEIDRTDGRSPNQLRPLACSRSVLNRAYGSASWTQGSSSMYKLYLRVLVIFPHFGIYPILYSVYFKLFSLQILKLSWVKIVYLNFLLYICFVLFVL